MTKIQIFVYIILIIFFINLLTAQNNQSKVYQVKYISAENVYLDAGKLQGLNVGDRLLIKRNGQTVAEIEVKYVSDHSASCSITNLTLSIQAGDKAYMHKSNAKPDTVSVTTGIKGNQPDIQKDIKPITPPSSGRKRSPFSGTFSLQYYYWKDLYETQLDFSQPTLRLSLRGRRLWGKDFNLRIRARLRHNQRARSLNSNAPEQEWRNRIYEISFSYDNINAPINYQMGRIISNKFSGVGYIDGLLLQYNASTKFHAGIFGGSQPQWQYSSFQTSIQKYGAYLNYVSGDYSGGRFESTLAAAGEYHGSTVSREFIYFQNSFYLSQKWTIFQSAEMDLNRSWRKEVAGEDVSLTNLFVSAQWNILKNLMVGAMYDNRQNYLTYETRSLADSLFDEALRQGFRGNVTVILPQNYRLFGNFGIRKRDTDTETTKSYAAGLSKVNFLMPNFRLYINAAGFSNFFTNGINYSFIVGKYFGNRINIDLAYGGYRYSLKADDSQRINQWARINFLSDIIGKFFLSGQYEYDWGDDMKGHRVLAEIGYRL
ncbi:MAG: hypothetical protein JSW33_16755 [bacterium]|nr:MAG: hypothetical protein JSW33_16755 [bacterium]